MKRPYTIALFVLVPLCSGAAAYYARSYSGRDQWARLAKTDPVIECPTSFDLGAQELGTVVNRGFTIQNSGGGTLIVEDIQTSCVCTGLERVVDGSLQRVESLRLEQGDKADVVVRVSVRGTPNTPFQHSVRFRTNDPLRPVVVIDVTVSNVIGGISITPAEILFDRVRTGLTARKTVDVFDGSGNSRAIRHVWTSSPERLAATVVKTADGAVRSSSPEGEWIGRVEVTLKAASPGPLNEQVFVEFDEPGRPPRSITVAGVVADAVEFFPRRLILPRSSQEGDVYHTKCLVRCNLGAPFTLAAVHVPDDLDVTLPSGNADTQLVRVEWKPGAGGIRKAGQREIRFNATVGQDVIEISLPVECRNAKELP